ncbi:MAG: hypothetical protein IK020_11055 [Clostridiales bacterium]|nr:hypothetical protein [Clostridiales bacterium]
MKRIRLRNTLLFIGIITILVFSFGCAKAAVSSSKDTIPREKVVTRPEGTSSGEYQDVFWQPTTDADGRGPTGLPAGVFEPQIMINGKIYTYRYDGERVLPDGYSEIGKLLEVNDYRIPERDFCGAGGGMFMASGQSIYATEGDDTVIYVKIEDKYYAFRCEE